MRPPLAARNEEEWENVREDKTVLRVTSKKHVAALQTKHWEPYLLFNLPDIAAPQSRCCVFHSGCVWQTALLSLWEQDSSATGTNLREYGPFSLTKCLHKASATLLLAAHFTLGQSDRCPNSGLLPFNGFTCSRKQQKEALLCYFWSTWRAVCLTVKANKS